jgi:FkbM family methyltransferase
MPGVASAPVSRAFKALLVSHRTMKSVEIDRFVLAHPWIRSALRSLYRPAYRLLAPGGLVTGERHGLRISADSSQRDLALLLLGGGAWEERQVELIRSLLREGMTFVDVGAHIGLYTVLAAHCVGPAGRVYAFEPAPDNVRLLRHNVAQNKLSNVTVESLAVSRSCGRAPFRISSQDSASHTLAPRAGGRTVEVETTSLDEYFSALDAPIGVLKLDAEGAEPEILAGMVRILARHPEMILFTEFYPRAIEALGNSAEQFLAHLHELRFNMARVVEDVSRPEPLSPEDFASLTARLLATGAAVNLLCRREPPAPLISPGIPSRAGDMNAPVRKPLLSLAIPTYQRAALLAKTLQSILPQIEEGIEVVVCDTGSTDSTPEMLARLAAAFPALRFVCVSERRSLDEALLLLLEAARGEYIWFFSSDDQLKPGALAAARRAILSAGSPPALVYLNQEITDEAGHTLIRRQVRSKRNRQFADGRKIVPRLGLNLGFISASLIRRNAALGVKSAPEFVGTRSLNLHLYLGCLLAGGRAIYLGDPWIEARRATGVPPYEYREVFVRHIARIFADARRRGFPRLAIFRAMHRSVMGAYLRLVVSWRADDPAELARTFPAMWRACWIYPAFWLLLLPARWAPPKLLRALRQGLREWRAWRIQRERADSFTPGGRSNCAMEGSPPEAFSGDR